MQEPILAKVSLMLVTSTVYLNLTLVKVHLRPYASNGTARTDDDDDEKFINFSGAVLSRHLYNVHELPTSNLYL